MLRHSVPVLQGKRTLEIHFLEEYAGIFTEPAFLINRQVRSGIEPHRALEKTDGGTARRQPEHVDATAIFNFGAFVAEFVIGRRHLQPGVALVLLLGLYIARDDLTLDGIAALEPEDAIAALA